MSLSIYLNILLFFPWLVIACYYLPKVNNSAKLLHQIGSMLLFIGSIGLFAFSIEKNITTVTEFLWIPTHLFSYSIGLDRLGLVMILLTTGLFFANTLFLDRSLQRKHFALLMATEGALLGLFSSGNLIQFYIYWELVMIPVLCLFLLNAKSYKAGLYLFFYTLAGSFAMFGAVVILSFAIYYTGGKSINFETVSVMNPSFYTNVLWVLFALSFAIKSPLFLFHAWQPAAYKKGPGYLTPLLAALISKMGIFGLYRINYPYLGEPSLEIRTVLLTIAVIGVLYSAWLASVQKNPYKILAYSSMSHLNLIWFAVLTNNPMSWTGALFMTVQHAIIAFGLFSLMQKVHPIDSTKHSSKKALLVSNPLFAGLILFIALANIGLPGLSGFIGEFAIFLGAFPNYPVWVAVCSLVVILSANYTFRWLKVFLFTPSWQSEHSKQELLLHCGIAFLLIFFGLFPQPLLFLVAQ